MKQLGLYCTLYATLLVGCAGNVPAPLPRIVRVEVPIIQPCPVQIPPIVPYATDNLTKESSDFDKIRAILVERQERQGVELELRELLGACIKPLNTNKNAL